VLSHVSADKAGNRVLVHLLNYATEPADSVLVRVTGDFRKASYYTPEGAPKDLVLEKSEGRVEVNVPSLSVYGVILLDK
jgi:hypothetical protein